MAFRTTNRKLFLWWIFTHLHLHTAHRKKALRKRNECVFICWHTHSIPFYPSWSTISIHIHKYTLTHTFLSYILCVSSLLSWQWRAATLFLILAIAKARSNSFYIQSNVAYIYFRDHIHTLLYTVHRYHMYVCVYPLHSEPVKLFLALAISTKEWFSKDRTCRI